MKVETAVARNRKFVKAGPGPSWLWLCGLAYAKESLTDGFIPTEALPFLGVKAAPALVRHLVAAGLWDAEEGGWRIHDYFEHNKSAADVRSDTDAKVDAGRKGGKASGGARRSASAEALREAPASAVLQHPAKPEESRAERVKTETESSRPPAPHLAAQAARPPVGRSLPDGCPFDEWFAEFSRLYPARGKTAGPLPMQAFLAVFQRDTREPLVVWQEIRTSVAGYGQSEAVRAGKVKNMTAWLDEGYYAQRHEGRAPSDDHYTKVRSGR